MAKPERLSIPARIVVEAPPRGVTFALQRGRSELDRVVDSDGRDLEFDFTFLTQPGDHGSPRFSGEFVQGPSGGKFVYVNSGTLAGQFGSCWTRRAKVGLQTLTWAALEGVASEPGSFLQAHIAGTGRDGGPACATVPLLGKGWVVARSAARGRAR